MLKCKMLDVKCLKSKWLTAKCLKSKCLNAKWLTVKCLNSKRLSAKRLNEKCLKSKCLKCKMFKWMRDHPGDTNRKTHKNKMNQNTGNLLTCCLAGGWWVVRGVRSWLAPDCPKHSMRSGQVPHAPSVNRSCVRDVTRRGSQVATQKRKKMSCSFVSVNRPHCMIHLLLIPRTAPGESPIRVPEQAVVNGNSK
jgi:hypothetical protein